MRDLLARLSRLRGDASPLGLAHAALGEAATRVSPSAIEREYFNLFIGLGRGELLPYASYYLTGFLNERPLARLRDDLAAFGVERVDGNYEPEDHAATLCEIMAAFAGGRFAAPEGAERTPVRKAHGAVDAAASSPISSARRLQTSIATSARSAASSSTSKRKPLRCRVNRTREKETEEDNRDAIEIQDDGRPS